MAAPGAGNGDVYSAKEASNWLAESRRRVLEHKPLTGSFSPVIAEAA